MSGVLAVLGNNQAKTALATAIAVTVIAFAGASLWGKKVRTTIVIGAVNLNNSYEVFLF
jgi:hypothetical protein